MSKQRKGGFVLLEIILSIALFSFVATAMVVALDKLGQLSSTAQKESRIFRAMDSVMAGVLHDGDHSLQPDTMSFPARNRDGVSVEVVVSAETMTSVGGAALPDMYKVHLTGRFGTVKREMERLVYSPQIQ